MNVLFVASCAPRPHAPRYGSFIHDMAQVLVAHGDSVTVLVPVRVFPDRALWRACRRPWRVRNLMQALCRWVALWYGAKGEKQTDGIQYVYVRFFSSPTVSRLGQNGVCLVRRFAKWWCRVQGMLDARVPDVVVGHFLDMAPLVNHIGAVYQAQRWVYVHEYPLAYGPQWGHDTMRDAVEQLDGLMCGSEANREALAEAGYPTATCRICPLPLMTPMPVLDPAPKATSNQSVVCWLYVARFSPNKRHDLLLDIVREWKDRHPETPVRLLLLGDDGPALPQIRDRLRGLQLVTDTDIRVYRTVADWQQAIREADLFLSTSAYESFGLAMCEAAAAGIPVLAYEQAGFIRAYRQYAPAILPVSHLEVDAFVRNLETYLQHARACKEAAQRLAWVLRRDMSPDAFYASFRHALPAQPEMPRESE